MESLCVCEWRGWVSLAVVFSSFFFCSLGLLLCVVRRGDGFQLEGAVVGFGCTPLFHLLVCFGVSPLPFSFFFFLVRSPVGCWSGCVVKAWLLVGHGWVGRQVKGVMEVVEGVVGHGGGLK